MASKKKIKVKDKPDLVRDTFSKAIINIDRSSYAAARARKKAMLDKDATVTSLKDDLDKLSKQYAELQKMFVEFIKTKG
jgi:hypothetical protein